MGQQTCISLTLSCMYYLMTYEAYLCRFNIDICREICVDIIQITLHIAMRPRDKKRSDNIVGSYEQTVHPYETYETGYIQT